jgi:hypothetical protein
MKHQKTTYGDQEFVVEEIIDVKRNPQNKSQLVYLATFQGYDLLAPPVVPLASTN